MNNKLLIGIWLCIAMSGTAGAQEPLPVIKWQRTIGGGYFDGQVNYFGPDSIPTNAKSLIKTRDHGYLVGARTGSSNGDATGSQGLFKPWTVKLDSSRAYQWSKNSGTGQLPSLYGSVIEATGGGYIMVGASPDGDDSTYNEDSQLLLTRFGDDGTLTWEKRYGGSNSDRGYSIAKNGTGGYLVTGMTLSSDGDAVSPSKGSRDLWIINIDQAGNLLWEKKFGGSGNDYGRIIKSTADGGFIIGASTTSADGDVSGAKGGEDIWLLKLNAAGNVEWQKVYGGASIDLLYDLVQDFDGGFVFAGETFSVDGNVTGNHGQNDGWIVKLNSTGNIVWQETVGGTLADVVTAITVVPGPYYVVAGNSTSSDGDLNQNYGGDDIFLAKFDGSGTLMWTTHYGGSDRDQAYSILPDNNGEFIILGETQSNNGDVSGNKGFSDLWLFAVGAANTLTGEVFFDMNANGIKDAGEENADNILIVAESPGGRFITSSVNGAYKLPVGLGSYNLGPQLANDYYTAFPATVAPAFLTYFNTQQNNFALQPTPGKSDLSIVIYAVTPARPGFDVTYAIYATNHGTQSQNATIELLTDPKVSFKSANQTPTSVDPGKFTWNIPALGPNLQVVLLVTFNINPPPATNNGDTLTQLVNILPVAGDISPADNSSTHKQLVTGSYDPNDKQESNGGIITPEQVTAAEPLNYLIRFQNTGTDTAFTVTVRDTLTSRVLPSSFQMIGASHPYRLELKNNNQLTWIFEDIKLVDSNMNEPLSHGYIAYKIKPIPELAVGDTVFNSASIYFDYNLPVITNNEFTVVKNLLALPVKLSYFRGLRAGEENRLFWEIQTQSHFSHFEMQRSSDGRSFVNLGKIPLNRDRKYRYEYIDAAPLDRVNYYRLKMVDIDGKFEYSPVVQLQYANDAAVSLSVYPNPAQSAFQLDLQGSIHGPVTVRILNQVGHSVKVIQLGKQQSNKILVPVSVNHLRKGTYFVQVTVGEKKFVKKMVVQ